MPQFLSPFDSPDPGQTYIVSVTRLKVRSPRTALSFFRRLSPVQRQMRNSPGLVAYGLRAQLTRMTFFTYGVFEDRRSLVEFVGSEAHGEAMSALRGRLPQVESRTIPTTGGELPANWTEIAALLTTSSSRLKVNNL